MYISIRLYVYSFMRSYLLLIILIIYNTYLYIYISILSQNNQKHNPNLQEHQIVNLVQKCNSTIPCTHAVVLEEISGAKKFHPSSAVSYKS